jgi:hypothetical protein
MYKYTVYVHKNAWNTCTFNTLSVYIFYEMIFSCRFTTLPYNKKVQGRAQV